jgi:NitT/TauT family transport system permease protein
VAWAEKFKSENQGAEKTPESWLINLFRRTRLLRLIGRQLSYFFDAFVNFKIFRSSSYSNFSVPAIRHNEQLASFLWNMITLVLGMVALIFVGHYLYQHIAFNEIEHVFLLGMMTATRVFVLIVLCSLIWVPIGVWIGLKPKVAQIGQPVAQLLAAFPANLLYPFIVVFIVTYHLSPDVWLTPLMILGAQWYILFNVIAGASTIPKDLLQVTDNFGVVGRLRWSRLILPSIAPYYITGAITAAGGAWNASIVAEVASWGNTKLMATGLGAYISEYTSSGDFSRTVLGIGMMCVLVLIINRSIWRPLYRYTTSRFSLE